MARYALGREPKQTYIYILLKVAIVIEVEVEVEVEVAIVIEITIAIDEPTLAAALPVQGGKDGYHLYMHSPSRISTKIHGFK